MRGALHDVEQVLLRLGGCATWRQLRRHLPGRTIRAAARGGVVVRARRGRYQLRVVHDHRQLAHRTSGTLSHLSAAVAHGWAVKTEPDPPWVTYPRTRHLTPVDAAATHPSWRDLPLADRERGITAPVLTVIDCARVLPFDETLAIADSALRDGDVTRDELVTAASQVRGHGARQARTVAHAADARAANPMESVLRAIALEFPQLTLEPQYAVWDSGLWARVDLGDRSLRLALEAEGFEAHSTRKHLHRDARRYTELTVWQWAVLRFSWEDVMHDPDWVRWAIRSWLDARRGVAVPPPPTRRAT